MGVMMPTSVRVGMTCGSRGNSRETERKEEESRRIMTGNDIQRSSLALKGYGYQKKNKLTVRVIHVGGCRVPKSQPDKELFVVLLFPSLLDETDAPETSGLSHGAQDPGIPQDESTNERGQSSSVAPRSLLPASLVCFFCFISSQIVFMMMILIFHYLSFPYLLLLQR